MSINNLSAHARGAHEAWDIAPLPSVMIEPLVRATLLEDLGRAGDVTTNAIVPAGHRGRTAMVARQPGVVAGMDVVGSKPGEMVRAAGIEPARPLRAERF